MRSPRVVIIQKKQANFNEKLLVGFRRTLCGVVTADPKLQFRVQRTVQDVKRALKIPMDLMVGVVNASACEKDGREKIDKTTDTNK